MKTQQLLSILRFIFWIIFIGLLIKTGTTIVAFFMSLSNIDGSEKMYLENLHDLRLYSKWEFICMGSLVISILALQSFLAYLVIKIASKGNIKHPFTLEIGNLISKTSHIALGIGVLSAIAMTYSERIIKKGIVIPLDWGAKEFLFLATIIFIIAKVFQKGIELQTENDLTV